MDVADVRNGFFEADVWKIFKNLGMERFPTAVTGSESMKILGL